MSTGPNTPQSPAPVYQQPVPGQEPIPVYQQPVLPSVTYQQPMPQQPVYQQPMPQAGTPQTAPAPTTTAHPPDRSKDLEVILYTHSNFIYWWPVWVVGFLMAALTRLQGELITIGHHQEWFHPNKNIGVLFTVTLYMVILFTNAIARGLASIVLVLTVMFLTILFAYLGWWEVILSWIPYLSVHMNFGFYVLFSSAIFLTWVIMTFIYDHLTYWRVRPGQITQEHVIGGATKSYDTRGMEFEKQQQDLFRQWILGLGAGDIRILTAGPHRETFVLSSVMFVSAKVRSIQRLIAIQPDTLAEEPPFR